MTHRHFRLKCLVSVASTPHLIKICKDNNNSIHSTAFFHSWIYTNWFYVQILLRFFLITSVVVWQTPKLIKQKSKYSKISFKCHVFKSALIWFQDSNKQYLQSQLSKYGKSNVMKIYYLFSFYLTFAVTSQYRKITSWRSIFGWHRRGLFKWALVGWNRRWSS